MSNLAFSIANCDRALLGSAVTVALIFSKVDGFSRGGSFGLCHFEFSGIGRLGQIDAIAICWSKLMIGLSSLSGKGSEVSNKNLETSISAFH